MICTACKKTIGQTEPRTIIEGNWHCMDCTYFHDFPEKEPDRQQRPARPSAQQEVLFTIEETAEIPLTTAEVQSPQKGV